MSQRFEGRNLEEALQHAAQTLGVERWQLTHHTLSEKRGFLGGVKRIVIEVDVNESATPPAVPPPSAIPADDEAPQEAAPASPAREPRAPRANGSREGGRGRGSRGDRELQVGDFEAFLGDVPEQGAESESAAAVRTWCERAISLSKLDLIVRTDENDSQINVTLYGPDSRRMTDRHGELLDALQVLAIKALVGQKTEKDIELDCDGFKQHRNEDLAAKARAVADRVRSGGREEMLPAMSPIERRIVHIALRDDADVTTESRGEGFFKRVAIILRSEASSQDESAPAQES